jgi:hypothetical protein
VGGRFYNLLRSGRGSCATMPERKPYAPLSIPEKALPRHDPYAAFRFVGFALYTAGNFISIAGRQMLTIAIEWEVYARTHSATALGPGRLGRGGTNRRAFLAGRASRRSFQSQNDHSLVASGQRALFRSLALISWNHLAIPRWPILLRANDGLRAIATLFERHPAFHFDDLSLPLIYFVMLISGSVRTFGWAARSSYFPKLVPRDYFANAVTWNSSIFQISCVLGPAAGGFLIVRLGFPFIYALDACCALAFFLLMLPIKSGARRGRVEGNDWLSLAAGIRFVLRKKVILATITLDLFAVLLGGATALLPIFADQILRCGPIGLWVVACRTGDRRIRDGRCNRLSTADEARGPHTPLVRDGFRRCHDRLRRFPLVLALASNAVADRRF